MPSLRQASMFQLYLAALVFLAAPILGAVTWNATPFNPPSVPLAVRSPYLSAWLHQGEGGTTLNGDWPKFWTGMILGWAGLARVDGTAYLWLGVPAFPNANVTRATQKSLHFTSTQSVFVMTAGPVDLTITFLSPAEPHDLVNQSLPFSYYSVSAASNNGKSHSVQIYADTSGEWISGNLSLIANWNSTTTGNVLTHEVRLASESPFTEINDRIQQGSGYHSTFNTASTTYQTGQDVVLRAGFSNNGKLNNTLDTNFRGISDNWPVFAFAHDLGNVTSASDPVVFTVGHVRDPALQYIVANHGIQLRSSLFWTRFPTVVDAISAFVQDYPNALARANAFDAQVNSDASKVSDDYASIVALSIRQALGTTEITVGKQNDGSFNTSDVMTFMKEISSSSNVNVADSIYSAWPLVLYTNPEIGKQLLLPLLAYQATGQYPNPWSVHDVGTSYPNATGHNSGGDLLLPVEECGNMVIMALSYTQRTKDTSLITTYYNLLDQWTQYLISGSLTPATQLSSDDFAGSLGNQTNLAVKGIIGIKAMSQIAELVGDTAKSSNYSSLADSYLQQWQSSAVSSDNSHLTLSYGDSGSWGLAYNLYADRLLNMNFIPSTIYDMETEWYSKQGAPYGIPLDTRHTYTKSDWQLWTAALVTSTSVRDQLTSGVSKLVSTGKSGVPFPDLYDTNDASQLPAQNIWRARPVVGGHLALLALTNTSFVSSQPPSPLSSGAPSVTSTNPPGTNTGTAASSAGGNPTTTSGASPANSGTRLWQKGGVMKLSTVLGTISAAFLVGMS